MIDLSAITGLTSDSRAVKPGYLFAALKGAAQDGQAFIPAALEAGATIILTDRPYAGDLPGGARLWLSEDPRGDFARACAQFYGGRRAQPDKLVAVTGTNGKSSVVSFCEQIWRKMGVAGTSLGTINSKLTSLDPVALHEKLRALKQDGVTHLALEASSHGLDQKRMDGLSFDAVAFTNLSRDHLDYHETMEGYLAAKARLFSGALLTQGGVCVINADAPQAAKLQAVSAGRLLTYGVQGQALCLEAFEPTARGAQVRLSLFGHVYDLLIPLIGQFQIMNLLCALGLVIGAQSRDHDPDKATLDRYVDVLKAIEPVRGRLQAINGHPAGAQIFVDYAHTPDALETVLQAVRPHVKGRVFCLFGCGGDRDRGKRPLMGQVAANRSDIIIITDDNPRNEKAVDIRKDILAPLQTLMHNETVFEIGDRAAAIDFSIQQLTQDDALIIAGKGHETGQILSDRVLPFDDAQQAREALARL